MMEDILKHRDEILQNPGFDVEKIRGDFAYLQDEKKIVYLDNAATTQRPNVVVDRVSEFYRHENANPLRGNHLLSLRATEAYEGARAVVQRLLHANEAAEVVFTRNATEALNLVAYSYGLDNLKEGDEVLISRLEHHSNSVPWQYVCQKTGATLVYFELTDDYQLDVTDYESKLSEKTKIVSFSGASNVTAAIPDAKAMIEKAHAVGAIAVVDGAQLVPHETVDVQNLDCDFLVFSGHKMLAPFGIGVLYGKRALLEEMSPFLYGGEMIEYVYDDHATFAELPYKFEAGTQDVGGAVGLAAAIDYLENIGLDNIERYEKALADYTAEKMRALPYIELYHPKAGNRGSAIAFNIQDVHPHDVSTIFDSYGIAIRSGHHCAQQLHRALNQSATCRVSLAFYNTVEEVDYFLEKLGEVRKVMGY